jgi:DNA (cytosine-5)-methyltransferase 1
MAPNRNLPQPKTFIDLCAGIGGFHVGLMAHGLKCLLAADINPDLQGPYFEAFPDIHEVYKKFALPQPRAIHGDFGEMIDSIPEHDVLCAGFPCQPFSKSGQQLGLKDPTSGTVFHTILEVIKYPHRKPPSYLFLENVGNFERHDNGRTWQVIQNELRNLGYAIRGTGHHALGGKGLLSPDQFGFPHHRERFFILAIKIANAPISLETERLFWSAAPFPRPRKPIKEPLTDFFAQNRASFSASLPQQPRTGLDNLIVEEFHAGDAEACALTPRQRWTIAHWNKLLTEIIPPEVPRPSFPIWGFEWRYMAQREVYQKFDAGYSLIAIEGDDINKATTPYAYWASANDENRKTFDEFRKRAPRYACSAQANFPNWKRRFIRQNREYYKSLWQIYNCDKVALDSWIEGLFAGGAHGPTPASLVKLEWNCKEALKPGLGDKVLQFRPSGLRVKHAHSIPALVAMTPTQIPIIPAPSGALEDLRFLTIEEGILLQGFPRGHLNALIFQTLKTYEKAPAHRVKTAHIISNQRMARQNRVRQVAFKALGNAVHAGLIEIIANHWFSLLDHLEIPPTKSSP